MSKTIPIPVQVLDWARWVAQDESGDWFMYENKPVLAKDYWTADGDRWEILVCCDPNPNWRETLREVA